MAFKKLYKKYAVFVPKTVGIKLFDLTFLLVLLLTGMMNVLAALTAALFQHLNKITMSHLQLQCDYVGHLFHFDSIAKHFLAAAK